MSTLSEEQAAQLALAEGFGLPEELGPNAPRNLEALRQCTAQARDWGYSIVIDSAELGVSAVACPVYTTDGRHSVGTLGMAAPTARMNEETLHRFGRLMIDSSPQLSDSLEYAAMALSIKNTNQAKKLSGLSPEFELTG